MNIEENIKHLLAELPDGVQLVAAAKSRTVEEIRLALKAGVKIFGQNYLQEAIPAFEALGREAEWHFIGHLQRNKVKKAVEIFDMIETVDSVELAHEIHKRCLRIGKRMSVLIEVNSGREAQKSGVVPEAVEDLICEISTLPHLKVQGLMTMGPLFGNPEDARPFFVTTREIFEAVRAKNVPGVEMKFLSMGMTNSYRVAIREGANMVRIGTKIFGPR